MTQEDFEGWKQHPVTRKLFERMSEERLDMMEGIINDNFEHPEEVKGRCKAINNILGMTYEDLYDHRKQVGNTPAGAQASDSSPETGTSY